MFCVRGGLLWLWNILKTPAMTVMWVMTRLAHPCNWRQEFRSVSMFWEVLEMQLKQSLTVQLSEIICLHRPPPGISLSFKQSLNTCPGCAQRSFSFRHLMFWPESFFIFSLLSATGFIEQKKSLWESEVLGDDEQLPKIPFYPLSSHDFNTGLFAASVHSFSFISTNVPCFKKR